MIDKEDLIEGFKYINPKVNYVRLGAGVLVAPHTDPFLHPSIYEFIKLTSDHFPPKKDNDSNDRSLYPIGYA